MRWWKTALCAGDKHVKCAEYLNHVCACLEFVPHRIAEIGVFRGNTSRRLRYFWPHAELVLVDPWIIQPKMGGWCYRQFPEQSSWDGLYQGVCDMFKGDSRVRILRMNSAEAAPLIEPASLDMVFIDAIHMKAAVLEDIALWKPKLRKPGIIAGHDYNVKGPYRGVGEAVAEAFGPKGFIFGSPKMWLQYLTGPRVK